MKLLQRLKNLFLPEGEVSDGFHTFDELYHYRMLYNAAFFNGLGGRYETRNMTDFDNNSILNLFIWGVPWLILGAVLGFITLFIVPAAPCNYR